MRRHLLILVLALGSATIRCSDGSENIAEQPQPEKTANDRDSDAVDNDPQRTSGEAIMDEESTDDVFTDEFARRNDRDRERCGSLRSSDVNWQINGQKSPIDVLPGRNVTWSIRAQHHQDSDCAYEAYEVENAGSLNNLRVENNRSDRMRITGIPDNESVNELEVVARNYMLCRTERDRSDADCDDHDRFNSKFDIRGRVQWQLTRSPQGVSSLGRASNPMGARNFGTLAAISFGMTALRAAMGLPNMLTGFRGPYRGFFSTIRPNYLNFGGGFGTGFSNGFGNRSNFWTGSSWYGSNRLSSMAGSAFSSRVGSFCQNRYFSSMSCNNTINCVWVNRRCVSRSGMSSRSLSSGFRTCFRYTSFSQCSVANCSWNGFSCTQSGTGLGSFNSTTNCSRYTSTPSACRATMGCSWSAMSNMCIRSSSLSSLSSGSSSSRCSRIFGRTTCNQTSQCMWSSTLSICQSSVF